MTPQQIQLVQQTMPTILTQNHTFATTFYNHLFALDPALRFLFDPYMDDQEKILVQALEKLVRNLHKQEKLIPALRYLGQQHAYYGVRPADYDLIRQALLAALAQTLGPAFTTELKTAWLAALTLMSQTMTTAAEQTETTPGL